VAGVIEVFDQRIRSFNTFGGNPVSCAMAHAVLKVIKAGQRLVLISATAHEGQILKIRHRWYSRRGMLSCSSPPWTRC